jgi:hypothetical protein
MASPRQGDLFSKDEGQAEAFDDESNTPTWHPDPDEVRAELKRILAEARAAETMPWDVQRESLYRTIFPQMTQCLPEEEGALLRFEFETEMERLKAA